MRPRLDEKQPLGLTSREIELAIANCRAVVRRTGAALLLAVLRRRYARDQRCRRWPGIVRKVGVERADCAHPISAAITQCGQRDSSHTLSPCSWTRQ